MTGKKRENGCCWHFAPQTGRDAGPNEELPQNFKQSPYPSLIRESIQNSLDAVANEDEPVIVEISFKQIQSSYFPNFFDIKKHIEGCIKLYSKHENVFEKFGPMLECFTDNSFKQQIGLITISDSNTKGMPYIEGDTNCPFYAFALSKGVSAKDTKSPGGSYGFGKEAYFNISPIRTVFISTRTTDEKNVFVGVSSLCTHVVDGKKLTSVGYYDNNNGHPVTEEDDIPSTFRRSEPGTSISILGFDMSSKDAAIKEMAIAVLRNFWMAIYSNKLSVKIGEKEINAGNIAEVMADMFPDDIDNAQKRDHYNPRPYFDAVRYATSNGKRYIKIEAKIPVVEDVIFYVNLNPNVNDKVVFMRKPLMYVYSKKQSTSFGYNAVFVCTSDKGNKILKNIEDPAHTEWKPENWKIRMQTVQDGKDAVEAIDVFIKETLNKLVSNGIDSTLQISGLDEFLYVPECLVADSDSSSNKESANGIPNGNESKDSGSFSTEIKNPEPNIEQPDQTKNGRVLVTNPGDIDTDSPKEGGEYGKGPKNKRTKTKGGNGTGGRRKVEGSPTDVQNSSYGELIPVTFRVVAQSENNIMYHTIIYYSPIATENGEIEIEVGGELNNEVIGIEWTSQGEIENNFIRKLSVIKGKNTLRIRLADNLKHSVILKAYGR